MKVTLKNIGSLQTWILQIKDTGNAYFVLRHKVVQSSESSRVCRKRLRPHYVIKKFTVNFFTRSDVPFLVQCESRKFGVSEAPCFPRMLANSCRYPRKPCWGPWGGTRSFSGPRASHPPPDPKIPRSFSRFGLPPRSRGASGVPAPCHGRAPSVRGSSEDRGRTADKVVREAGRWPGRSVVWVTRGWRPEGGVLRQGAAGGPGEGSQGASPSRYGWGRRDSS